MDVLVRFNEKAPAYTKGVIRREEGHDVLYILVSSKRSVA